MENVGEQYRIPIHQVSRQLSSKRPSIRIHLQSRTRTNLRRILLNLYYKRERYISVRQLFRKKITKGDVFLLFPREWHTYRPAKDIGWNEYFVTFQGEYFNKLLNKIFQPNDPIIHIGINEQIVKHFLEMLDCAKAQSPGFQAVMAGIMMHMIGDIYSINKNYDCEPASLQKIQEACVLILENIYDKLTPEDIAESINMSYSNFRKSFKQYTGIAPHQYMLQLKLSKIKDLLSSTEMSIQDIAMKLNFESADYFSYFFRSKTGINPLSYRKEIEKQREKAKKNSH